MLSSLKINNFRMLESFEVERLGRVNLIVGRNNSGKSTVLEALRIYARQANPILLDEILGGHDENISSGLRPSNPSVAGSEAPYQHFFPHREFPKAEGLKIYIGDRDGANFVTIEHVYYIEEIEDVSEKGDVVRRTRRRVIPKSDTQGTIGSASQGLSITTSRPGGERPLFPIRDRERDGYRSRIPSMDIKELPLSFVPTQFLPEEFLAELWDRIALTANDAVIKQALQIVDSEVEGITFVKKDSDRSSRSRDTERTAIVKLRGEPRPIALNSMGDGMLRVLQLALAMFPAQGGYFLVDELENGLHFTVQEKIWDLIFALSTRLDIQVFAATHSWDCIEAFKNAAIKTHEDGVLFRVGRSVRTSDRGQVIATVFDEKSLESLTQADMEVR